MKNKIYLLLILLLNFIFIGEVKAESYISHNINATISTDGFSKDTEVSYETYKSIDMRFNRNTPYSIAYYNISGNGVNIENNVNSFTFPFAITDLEHNSKKMTCSSYIDIQQTYTFNYQTIYEDETQSHNYGVINESNGHPQLCTNFNISENNDYSITIGYKLNDNSKYNCLVTETGNSNVALCPISKEKSNGNYYITQIYFVFTRVNSDNETKFKMVFPTTIINQINLQQAINNKVDNINTSINSSNTSGGESSADDLKNNSAFQDNSGLSSVVSMPLTFVNSLSNTCQPISLNIPYFDVDMQIPCFQSIITEKMPALASIIKVVINGFIIYRVLLDIFQIIRNAKNPEDDRIEVLDL